MQPRPIGVPASSASSMATTRAAARPRCPSCLPRSDAANAEYPSCATPQALRRNHRTAPRPPWLRPCNGRCGRDRGQTCCHPPRRGQGSPFRWSRRWRSARRGLARQAVQRANCHATPETARRAAAGSETMRPTRYHHNRVLRNPPPRFACRAPRGAPPPPRRGHPRRQDDLVFHSEVRNG